MGEQQRRDAITAWWERQSIREFIARLREQKAERTRLDG